MTTTMTMAVARCFFLNTWYCSGFRGRRSPVQRTFGSFRPSPKTQSLAANWSEHPAKRHLPSLTSVLGTARGLALNLVRTFATYVSQGNNGAFDIQLSTSLARERQRDPCSPSPVGISMKD